MVKECLGPTVLTQERVRMFSRRAGDYMVSYYLLEQNSEASTPVDVSKMKKIRKTHTEMRDMDKGWLLASLKG